METYTITWTQQVEAETPQEAARIAHQVVRNPATPASVYQVRQVTESGEVSHLVDLRFQVPDLTVPGIPLYWKHGRLIAKADRRMMALLRMAGCQCKMPQLRKPGEGSPEISCSFCQAQVRLEP
jgi:hypothetical protein